MKSYQFKIRDLLEISNKEMNQMGKEGLSPIPKNNFFSMKKSRLRLLFLRKILYFYFRFKNRLQAQNVRYLQLLKDIKEPFVVVSNHSGHADVILHECLHAHFENLIFTFTDSSGLRRGNYPLVSIINYFMEIIPKVSSKQKNVENIVRRLIHGDNILFFPEGSFNLGLIMQAYSGIARIAKEYNNQTGKSLWILPSCSIGMHEAYNPYLGNFTNNSYLKTHYRGQKVTVRFGAPFKLKFSINPSKQEFHDKTTEVMSHVIAIWGQKRIRPRHNIMNTTHTFLFGLFSINKFQKTKK